MKLEDDPITDDEWLLRRVWKGFFPTQCVSVISNEAFKPRYKGIDIDTDGISLYREACVTEPCDILAEVAEQKRPDNGIVRISVAFVKSLGLTVRSAPDARIKGHVVIPELNAAAYATAKTLIVPILGRLSAEASKDENIVRRPGESKP